MPKYNNSPIRTISKNGLLFTILDPNKDNFLKLPSGEIIPIDHDYMIIHDGNKLLDYQEQYLDGRRGFAMRVGDCSSEEATQYVLDSYPAAAPYLYELWGKNYFKTDKYAAHSSKIESTKSKTFQPGFFAASATLEQPETVDEQVKTNLSEPQLLVVNNLIKQLRNEHTSYWPYLNKPLKLEKITALNALKEKAQTMPVAESVQWVIDNYPNALQGKISTRTADLLTRLSQENAYGLNT